MTQPDEAVQIVLPLLHGHYLKGAGIAKPLEEDVVSLRPAMRAVERGGRFGREGLIGRSRARDFSPTETAKRDRSVAPTQGIERMDSRPPMKLFRGRLRGNDGRGSPTETLGNPGR